MYDQFRTTLKQWLLGDNKNLQDAATDQFSHYLRQFPDTLSLLNQAEMGVEVSSASDRGPIPYLLLNYHGFPPEIIYSYNTHLLDRLCFAWYQMTDIDRVVIMGTDPYTGQKVLIQAETEISPDGTPRIRLYSYARGEQV